jgi:hypothetical protein
MDEQQKRVGTVTALVAKGSKPASAVPAPPALPAVSVPAPSAKPPKLLSAAQLRKLRAPCAKEKDPDLVSHHRLDPSNSLALVTLVCVSGAYNMVTEALIVPDNGPPRPAVFEWRGSGEEETLFNVEWDEQSRRLETYFKGRGIGDCGSTQSYAWDGRRFRLVEASHMGECRGAREFIRTFEARVVESR